MVDQAPRRGAYFAEARMMLVAAYFEMYAEDAALELAPAVRDWEASVAEGHYFASVVVGAVMEIVHFGAKRQNVDTVSTAWRNLFEERFRFW